MRADPKGASDPPLVLLHGFTQTAVSWSPVVDEVRRVLPGRTVEVPDLPGHGSADPDDDGSDLATTADRLADRMLDRFGRALVVGYSMGGRLALQMAVDRPDAVAGLLLVGATAGIDDPVGRAERRRADEALASDIEADGVRGFLDRWMALPLFTGFRAGPADLAARRANRAEGLAASLRHAGTGTMDPPLWDRLGAIGVPVTVSAGSRDAKFTALGRRLVDGIGANARFERFEDAGHTAHLEHPARTVELIVELLERLDRADRRGPAVRG